MRLRKNLQGGHLLVQLLVHPNEVANARDHLHALVRSTGIEVEMRRSFQK